MESPSNYIMIPLLIWEIKQLNLTQGIGVELELSFLIIASCKFLTSEAATPIHKQLVGHSHSIVFVIYYSC